MYRQRCYCHVALVKSRSDSCPRFPQHHYLQLLLKQMPDLEVVGGAGDDVPGATRQVTDGEIFQVSRFKGMPTTG